MHTYNMYAIHCTHACIHACTLTSLRVLATCTASCTVETHVWNKNSGEILQSHTYKAFNMLRPKKKKCKQKVQRLTPSDHGRESNPVGRSSSSYTKSGGFSAAFCARCSCCRSKTPISDRRSCFAWASEFWKSSNNDSCRSWRNPSAPSPGTSSWPPSGLFAGEQRHAERRWLRPICFGKKVAMGEIWNASDRFSWRWTSETTMINHLHALFHRDIPIARGFQMVVLCVGSRWWCFN